MQHWGLHWQFDYKLRPPRLIALHADSAVMVRYDAIDNGQTQPHAGFLRRKIGLEEPDLVFIRNALAVV